MISRNSFRTLFYLIQSGYFCSESKKLGRERLSVERQADGERCTLTYAVAFCLHTTTMQLDDALDDEKAKPLSARGASQRLICLGENLEQLHQGLGIDAETVVGSVLQTHGHE